MLYQAEKIEYNIFYLYINVSLFLLIKFISKKNPQILK